MSHLCKVQRLVPRLLDWFAVNARDLPWRRTRDPYAIWVSEIMLQQTQVATVIPYWRRWMRALPSVEKLARAKPERVLKLWEGLGYYSRAHNLQAAARLIVTKHNGSFPSDPDAIRALPGIGRYTAGAIGSIAFGQPRPIVDGNVTRVLTRIFGIRENPASPKTIGQLWELAGMMVNQADNCSSLNQSLMELGATVCTPRQPNCAACPVARACVARREGAFDSIPAKGPAIRHEEKQIDVFIVTDGERYIVQQRPAGGVNGGFWEFPNSENGAQWLVPKGQPPLTTARHSITRYRIKLKAYLIDAPGAKGEWVTLRQLHALPFTAAHRKLLPALTAGKQRAA